MPQHTTHGQGGSPHVIRKLRSETEIAGNASPFCLESGTSGPCRDRCHCLSPAPLFTSVKCTLRQKKTESTISRVRFVAGAATASRPVVGPTQPPAQWVSGVSSTGVTFPGRDADQSLPSGVEVEKTWSCTSTSHTSLWRGA